MHQGLQRLRPALVNRKEPILLYDNARSHVTQMTLQKMNELGNATLRNPAYSPDLSPSDYHFLKHLGIQQPSSTRRFLMVSISIITCYSKLRYTNLKLKVKKPSTSIVFSSRYSFFKGAPATTTGPPPCIFNVRTVATSTTAEGKKPEYLNGLHLS
uniref:Histone-lysine N-methyltransferase SETMAR n=1 Tax=Heterorhabditis bacteriophora TaxID=37862 RepID=A0A1I7W944_HETBA